MNKNDNIRVTTLRLGSMDNFIHCMADVETKDSMVVDPAWDFQAIEEHFKRNELTLVGVLLTHTHGDHISALADVLLKYDIPVYLTQSEYNVGRVKLDNPHIVREGDKISLGNAHVTVLETPGHTAGGACFYADNALITGDTLFIDGCGRCNFGDSDVEAMWDSLQKIKALSDDMVIYCGHHYGQKETDTLGNQKQTNPYLLIEDKAFFIEFRQHLQAHYRSIPFAPSSAEEMLKIRNSHSLR